MTKPVEPSKPEKPIEPNEESIKPKKTENLIFVSFLGVVFFIGVAFGLTIFAINCYTGKINFPMIGFLTTFLILLFYASGPLALVAIIIVIISIVHFISTIHDYIKDMKQYKNDLYQYNNNFEVLMKNAKVQYENDLIIYKSKYEEYEKQYKEYLKALEDYNTYESTSYSSTYHFSDTKEEYKDEGLSSKEDEKSSIHLNDGSGSSIGLKIEDGKLTGNDGYGLRYNVDKDNGRISGLNGDTKGYIKSDGTITDIDGWTKGRITEDGRVVDNCGNTIANSADELDDVIENLNKY